MADRAEFTKAWTCLVAGVEHYAGSLDRPGLAALAECAKRQAKAFGDLPAPESEEDLDDRRAMAKELLEVWRLKRSGKSFWEHDPGAESDGTLRSTVH